MDFSKAKWEFGQRQQQKASPVRPKGNSCDVCKNKGLKTATFHCDKCKVFYCSDCVSKHNNNPLFHDHHVTNLAADKNKCKPCRDHPSLNLEFLCRTCQPNCTLCNICVIHHEGTHNIVNLEKIAKEVHDKLQQGLGKIKAKSNQLREHIQMIKRKADHQDSVLITVHENIKKHALLLREGIQKREGELLQAAKEELDNRKDRYNQGAFDLELSNMERVTNELEDAIKSSDEHCISSHQRLEQQITYMINIEIPDERTSEREADMKFIPKNTDTGLQFGTLTYDTVQDNAAYQNTNTLKRKCGNIQDLALDSGLDSQCLSAMKTEPSSPSTSSAVHTVKKKKKKMSATGTGKPGNSTPQKTPLSDDRSKITQLCAASSSGVREYIISDELPIEQALQELIEFIGKHPVILCGHNIKENKCQALLHAITSCNLDLPFEKATAGFIDTFPLLTNKYGDGEPITIETLYQRCLGKTCKGDSLLSTVQALQTLVINAYPDRKERLSDSFKTEFIPNLHEYHTHRRSNFASWKPLVDAKVISRHIGQKAAASGLELKHLQFIYATQGLEGLTSLLSNPATEGKPRVTSSPKIIKDLAEYLHKDI